MAAKNTRSFEFRLGKIGLVLFIFGMSMLVFGSFLFGVRVGKLLEAYPDKIAGSYPAIIKWNWIWPWGKKDQEIAAAPEEEAITTGAKSEPDLTFYDTLNKKKGTEASESPVGHKEVKFGDTKGVGTGAAEKPIEVKGKTMMAGAKGNQSAAPMSLLSPGKISGQPPGAQLQPPTRQILSEPAKQSQASQKVAHPPAAGPATQETQAGQSNTFKKESLAIGDKLTKTPEASRKFILQVAAYKLKSKADQASKEMHALGYHSQVVMVDLHGKGNWYRVIVKGYDSEEKAQEAARELSVKAKGLHAIIRPEP
jgi:hypothetical protein